MSDIGIRNVSCSSLRISEAAKRSESFRVRDLADVAPLGAYVRRTNENNGSNSPLGLWIQGESPFSNRQLMVHSESTARKEALEFPLEDLSAIRSKLTPDGYASLMDVMGTIGQVKKEIEWNNPLSKLTVREKNALQESLGLYEEHFNRIVAGFSNAKFPPDADKVVEQMRGKVIQLLELISNVSRLIKREIRPSLADISLRV